MTEDRVREIIREELQRRDEIARQERGNAKDLDIGALFKEMIDEVRAMSLGDEISVSVKKGASHAPPRY
jgi:hypothetical protein